MADIDDLLSGYQDQIQSASRVLVGYSGGLDSTVLLAAAVKLVGPSHVLAVHINHQIDAKANRWEAHCNQVSERFGCAFYSERVSVQTDTSLEENARLARYQVFERILGEQDILLLGHHADDQVETFLFRLFRGSGIKGLSAIPLTRPLGRGNLLRPLLKYSRQDLNELAGEIGLDWIEDSSNADSQFDRNFIRNELLLLIKDRWTTADKQVLHAVDTLRDTDELLSEVAQQDLAACDRREEVVGVSLSIHAFSKMSRLRQDNLLRRFLFEHSGSQPNNDFLQVLRNEVLGAAEDTQPSIKHQKTEVRRFKDRLYIVPTFPEIDTKEAIVGEWLPRVRNYRFQGVWNLSRLEGADALLRVDFRRGGERLKPVDRDRSQTLKKLMLEYEIEPWLRDWMPIVYSGEEIIAVGDRIRCSDFRFEMQWSIEPID